MDKQVTFFGKTASGIFCQPLFGSSGVFEKTAGAPPFADWDTGDELRGFLSTVTKKDRQSSLYVLVNALGAGEYYGSNINADYFPWNALTHEGDDYGYKTFLRAHAFQHHVNKDPLRAFGNPVRSLLNMSMKRVELVIKLDKDKARTEGADGVLVRIDKGEFPDVSMGCKVPYDVCYVCGHQSKTRDDYCTHMRPPEHLRHIYGPNKILPDGRRCCVKNLHPRFFDISFVFIGADKTAKVMAKLASKGSQVCMGDVCSIEKTASREDAPLPPGKSAKVALSKTASICCDGCGTEKLAEAFGAKKTAAQLKVGEIVKSVPTGVLSMKKLPMLERDEPDIPKDVLNQLGRDHDLGSCCSTAGMLGIVLKPREFQRIVLVRMGEGDVADRLDNSGVVFQQSSEFDDSVPFDREYFKDGLASLLKTFLSGRSALGGSLRLRVMRVGADKKPLPTETSVAHPLLNKIGSAYNGYRRALLTKMSQVEDVVHGDPQLRDAVLGRSLVDMFSKTASQPLLPLDSVVYLAGAYLENRDLLHNTPVVDGVSIQRGLLAKDHY